MASNSGGLVLGITEDSDVATQPVELAAGDSLVLYTDGITEARAPGDPRQLDEDGVAAVLRTALSDHDGTAAAECLAEHLAGSLSEAAYRHAGKTVPDDAAVVVVRIDPTITA